MNRRMSLSLVAGLALSVTSARAQTSWIVSGGGSWHVGTNWSNGIPHLALDAVIANAGPTPISVTSTASAQNLTISNPLASVALPSGQFLTVSGNLVNDGLIDINSTGGGFTSGLTLAGPAVSITGTGAIRLGGLLATNDAGLTYSVPTNKVTHALGHTIYGGGTVHVNLLNQGLVRADLVGTFLRLETTPKTNEATFLATNGGILDIQSIAVTQTGAGVIRADAGIVEANGSIIGGVLEAIHGGLIRTGGALTLDGVTLNGPMHVFPSQTLGLVNGFTNNGVVTVNPNVSGFTASVSVNGAAESLEGPGEFVLSGSSPNDATITYGTPTNVLTHGSSHTIRGNGIIHVNLVNNGLVKAEGAGNTLQLSTTPKLNNSLMLAEDGGTLDSSVTVTQGPSGVIRADDGVFEASGGIVGGLVEAINGGLIRTGGSLALDGVTLEGDMHVFAAQTVGVLNGLTNNGTITVNAASSGSSAIVSFNSPEQTLQGDGEIVLNAVPATNDAYLTYSVATNVLNQAAEHTIRGSGQIYVSLVNLGLVTADVPGKTLQLLTTNKKNQGVMRSDGGILQLSGVTLDQTSPTPGLVEVNNAGTFLTQGSVLGGVIDASGGSMQLAGGTTLDAVTLEGPVNIPAATTLGVTGGGVVNNGTIHVNSNNSSSTAIVSANAPAVTIGGTGEIVLDATVSLNDAYITYGTITNVLTNGADHTIAGTGQLYVTLTNEGTLSPGHTLTGDDTQIIELASSVADVTCAPSSVVRIDLGGNAVGEFDTITGGSGVSFACGGTLELQHTGGYTGSPIGTTFDVIDVATVTGAFAELVAPALPGDHRYAVTYLADRVRVIVTCFGDCDANLSLDFFDFLCFQNEFTAGTEYADCDGSGALDFFDFLCFQNAFTGGCN